MANYKKCRTCNLDKELKFYNKRKDSKDGYRNDCKSCNISRVNKYYLKNKEYLDDKRKKWVIDNPNKVKKNLLNFLNDNPNYKKINYLKNKEKINNNFKKRRETDINFKLRGNIRNLIKNSLKYSGFKKNTKTQNILGCTSEKFKEYLQSKFESWMTWDNYGNPKDGIYEANKTWDIDHIIPSSSAICEKDIIKLNHYTNLQPLCSYNNRFVKKNK